MKIIHPEQHICIFLWIHVETEVKGITVDYILEEPSSLYKTKFEEFRRMSLLAHIVFKTIKQAFYDNQD